MVPRRLGAFFIYNYLILEIISNIKNIFDYQETFIITLHIDILRDKRKEEFKVNEIAKYIALGGTWMLVSYVGYIVKSNINKSNNTKFKIMSCRKQIKQFKRLDEADSNSIF